MAIINDIAVYKGEDIKLLFSMPTGVSVSGWSIVFTLKASKTDSTALAAIPAFIEDGPGGIFSVTIPASTLTRQAGKYAYDVQRTDTGSIAVLSIGTFVILQDVRVA